MKPSFNNMSTESCENSYSTTYGSSNGLTSGIPTRTTPTLTPTTLKNIEESFMDLQSIPPAPVEHHRQAGFVPPVVNISVLSHNSDSNGSYTSYPVSVKEEDSQWLPSCMQSSLSPNSNNSSASNSSSNAGKGRSGGRRSSRNERLSPEEEERRRIRRERNKLAAARCRKRRMDHTNSLLDETEGLEDKRQQLQEEIARLKNQKDDLEFLLEAHKASCKMNIHSQNRNIQVSSNNMHKEHSVIVSTSSVSKAATRPTSLSINPVFSNPGTSGACFKRSSTQFSEATGIPINTPSNGMFNFESLMEGGTGFTPIANCSTGLTPVNTGLTPLISCAGQQRSSSSDLSSPDTMNPPKLVSL